MIPTVAEERAMALRRDIPEAAAQLPSSWRRNGPVLSLVFFVLTCIGVGALFGLFALAEVAEGWMTCAICIGLAEYLIRRHRFFGTGVESALWIGGLFAFIVGLPGGRKPEALLLFAAAGAVAGLRVRNAWFGALGCAFVIGYFAARNLEIWAVIASLLISVTCLLLIARRWQRPSTEWLFILTLISAPVVGAVAGMDELSAFWAVPYLAFAAACFAGGVVLRHHAALLAGIVGVALGAVAARNLLAWSAEWKLIAAGSLLVVSAALISRALRGRAAGIVATPVDLSPYDEALQIGATVVMTPAAPATVPRRESGGSFGGAGATGEF